jgi:hypothetical protein
MCDVTHQYTLPIVSIDVPTEDGQHCMVEIQQDYCCAVWDIRISDALIRDHPEAIHAALGQALRELHHRYYDTKGLDYRFG